MQFVNNDMEDLFRKAAEDYPLNVQGAQWDKVFAALQETEEHPIINRGDNKRNYLWLLLLLPMFYVCELNGLKQKRETSLPLTNNKLQNEEQKQMGKAVENKTEQGLFQQEGKADFTNKATEGDFSALGGASLVNQPQKSITSTLETNELGSKRKRNKSAEGKAMGLDEEQGVAVRSGAEEKLNVVESIKAADSLESVQDTAGSPREVPESKEKIKPRQNRMKRFYAGIAGGPDFSAVKSAKFSGAGYSAGIFAGYRFSNKLSVELGLLKDNKKYYSKGKHFNSYALDLPYNAKVVEVTGSCNMWEVPLNIRYNLRTKNRNTLFAIAGISSYFMTSEDYHYVYERYNNRYTYQKEYYANSKNWFSIININAGFERKLSNTMAVRFEPYLKLPLKGVGIGKLPISSAGIMVGLTREIR